MKCFNQNWSNFLYETSLVHFWSRYSDQRELFVLSSLTREILTLILLTSALEEVSLHRRMKKKKVKKIETDKKKKNSETLHEGMGELTFLLRID